LQEKNISLERFPLFPILSKVLLPLITPMNEILQKLYPYSRDQAINDILSFYDQEESVVVNFIYFANIVSHRLFDQTAKTEKLKEYKKILLKSDFLLPDGIALQIFYYVAHFMGKIQSPTSWLQNLNGTDFIPYLLQSIRKKYGSQKLNILIYGTKAEYLEKVVEKLKYQGYNIIYAQDGYSDFDREKAEAAMNEYQDTINVLIQGRSTPEIPLQELRASRNFQKIQQKKLIVLNTAWLLDFIAWVQKRAPKIIRTLKLEWLYRFISDPKRNFKKILNSLKLFPYLIKYAILPQKTKKESK